MSILIISFKVWIITRTSNEKANELTKNAILCQNLAIFYRQKLAFLFQMQEKLKVHRSSELNFLRSSFIAYDSHVRIIWLHAVVFSRYDILHFRDNFHLLNVIQWNYLKTAFILSIVQIQQACKFPNFCLQKISKKIDLKVS